MCRWGCCFEHGGLFGTRFCFFREGRECTAVITRVTFGSVIISLILKPLLINAISFQQMGRLLSDKPFFPSVLLRSEPVAVRSKAASRRVAAKARPCRKAGPRPPQRRAGVSSCRKPASLFAQSLDLGSHRLPGSLIPHPKGRPA